MMDTSVDGRPLRWDLNELHLSNRTTKGLKTRYIPLSRELRAMLELRRYDPAGQEFGPNAYVFGNEVGERLKNYQSAGPTSTRCNWFLDHANISTSSRYLKPSKLALHTTIRRIDEHRRQSGEAAKWEQEVADLQKNLRQLPQNCHKLVKSARQRSSENDVAARKSNRLGA